MRVNKYVFWIAYLLILGLFSIIIDRLTASCIGIRTCCYFMLGTIHGVFIVKTIK